MPDSPSSFVTFGIIPVEKMGASGTPASSSEVPIYRLLQPIELDTHLLAAE